MLEAGIDIASEQQETPRKESLFIKIIRKLRNEKVEPDPKAEPEKEEVKQETELEEVQIPQAIPEETVTIPEDQIGVGINWQNTLSEMAETTPPPVLEERGVLAILGTNETYEMARLQTEIGELDGYICGVGFGNILSLVDLYSQDVLPKAILAVDVIPSVVLAGRISIELLKSSKDFNSFYESLISPATLEQLKKHVVEQETSSIIRERLTTVDTNSFIEDIEREYEYIYEKNNYEGSRTSVLTTLRTRFNDFKKLAQNGNIGISLADATSPDLIDSFSKLPDFSEKKSIIYLTNIIDHITDRGYYFGENNEYFSILKPYEKLANGKNFFLDTMTKMDYKLRASNKPPIYTPEDFGFKDMYDFLMIQKHRKY